MSGATYAEMYAAALAADTAYGDACRAAYGPTAYPDSRYYPRHADSAVLAAYAVKRAADDALRASMLRPAQVSA